MSKALVIAAHPDDEVLGCGGTMARYATEGHEVNTLILGEGVTARDNVRDSESRKEELTRLRDDARKANGILGVKEVFFGDFPDNRFDTVPLLDIIKTIEKTIFEVEPEHVYTHYSGDLNIDHRITTRAVMTACRPIPETVVKDLVSFEVCSSTEWDFTSAFRPNRYTNISRYLKKKKEAMMSYRTEMREFPHPRSLRGIEVTAAYRGMQSGICSAEAFMTLRNMR